MDEFLQRRNYPSERQHGLRKKPCNWNLLNFHGNVSTNLENSQVGGLRILNSQKASGTVFNQKTGENFRFLGRHMRRAPLVDIKNGREQRKHVRGAFRKKEKSKLVFRKAQSRGLCCS